MFGESNIEEKAMVIKENKKNDMKSALIKYLNTSLNPSKTNLREYQYQESSAIMQIIR